ncbi:MAG: hypothetical protein IJV85_01310 [Clostridia bacterium]|nr:hypothetical protein [Clostridia bacterium]
MKNLELYERVRNVPKEAQKTIEAGRLKGKTDINPMWRIKKLTEEFGPCGFCWYAPITERWIEEGANGEKTANIRINLFVKMNGEWSEPIEGIGGSLLIAKETSGLRTDDDCFKKAYTDAISVACKALGFGGDIYWQKDPTKYDEDQNTGGRYENTDKKPLSKKEFCDRYSVIEFEKCIAWYEMRLGNHPYEKWTADEIAIVEEDLARSQKDREAKHRAKAASGEVPFKV